MRRSQVPFLLAILVVALAAVTVLPGRAYLQSLPQSLRLRGFELTTDPLRSAIALTGLRRGFPVVATPAVAAPKAAAVFASYTSNANGNWTDGTTWLGGVAPPSTLLFGDVVNIIGHTVTYNNPNDLEVFGTVNVTNGTFQTPFTPLGTPGQGKSVFIRATGEWHLSNGAFLLPVKSCGYGCNTGTNLNGNWINENGVITIINSRVEVAQNWSDTSSPSTPGLETRTVTGGCLRIGESFINTGSVDIYSNTCIEIGFHGSGNWENKYDMTYQNSCIIKLIGTSGNLDNKATAPHGVFGGPGLVDIFALKVSGSGNLVNDAPWSAQVANFCIGAGTVGGSAAADFTDDVAPGGNDTVAACVATDAVNCNSCVFAQELDFGDAPDNPYKTSALNGGASHVVSTQVFIGSSSPATDGEAGSSFGNALANVDDTTVTDDETFLGNGPVGLSIAQSATAISLNVPVTNSSPIAVQLCGWIDFNIAGGFEVGLVPIGEGRCVGVPSAVGAQVAVLTWAAGTFGPLTAGQSYLRLRISDGLTAAFPAGPLGAGEVEDHPVTISSTTAVELASFNAYQLGDSVFIDWKTGFEADNLGFNLYRETNGQLVQVTPSLLAGSALMVGLGNRLEAGLPYAWRDDAGADAANSQYWLEEVDLKGDVYRHGPFNVSSGESLPLEKRRLLALQPRALRLSELADRINRLGVTRVVEPTAELEFTDEKTTPDATASRSASLRGGNAAGGAEALARSTATNRLADLSGQYAVKIDVKRAGWYRVSQAEIAAAGLGRSIDPRNLQLYAAGKQVPIRVTGEEDGSFDKGDAVEFYGVGLDIPSTDGRVYWLMASRLRGQRMPSSGAGGGGSPPPSFSHTVIREDRLLYVAAVLNGDAENFFGMPLASSIPTVTQALASPNVLTDASVTATLEVAIQGVSGVNHSVAVSLNGTTLGTINFEGQENVVQTYQVAHSQLVSGNNLVKLDRLSPEADVFLVDYLKLTYQHTWKADGNSLLVEAQSGQKVSIGGFTAPDVRILDVTNPDSPVELAVELTGEQSSGYTATSSVNGGAGARTLYAFTSDHALVEALLEANQPSTWKRPQNGADFLVISHASLMDAVQPLVELRRSQGWRVALIDVEDLYDEFTYGSKTPEAISDFIAYAASTWKVKPKAVMLVGKGTYDPRYYMQRGDGDLVPIQMAATETMESAVDDSFADFDQDGVPELAVGRLPVRTAAEARQLVAKIIAYESSPPSNRVALIADVSDTFNFDGVNDQLQGAVPAGVQVDKISRGQMGDSVARSKVLEAVGRANKIVNYSGHESIELWRGNLLTTADSAGLQKREEVSLFVMMTCLNGYFISPLAESLGESLLKAPGGAVAAWGSSGTTTPEGQQVMNLIAFQQLFGSSNLTIGEAARAAKAAVAEPDVRRTWNLLGDPTMRLK